MNMKKIMFFVILCVVQQFLYGQKKEIETALAGSRRDGIYTIKPEKVVFEDQIEKKWKKEFEERGLEIVNVYYEKRWVYGYESECVSQITFATKEYMNKVRAFKYANEKAFYADCSKAKEVNILIQTKKQYPDYVCQCPYRIFSRYNFKENELEQFIATFLTKENENDLMNMAWENCGAVKFINIIKNYKYAENKTYNDMQSVYQNSTSVSEIRNMYTTVKDVIPLLKEYVDLTRLQNLMMNFFNKDILLCNNSPDKIKSYMFYTGNKYFSKSDLDNYYSSNNDFKTLLREINNSPLSQSSSIINDMYKIYFDKKFNQNGISAWRDLTADFPEKKDEIINRTKSYVSSPVDYYQYKWSADIQPKLRSVQSTRNSLQSYINAEVPDDATMQLAKQYLNNCHSIASKYATDLSKATAYESSLREQVWKIRETVQNTNIVPDYIIKERYQYNKYCDWIEVDIIVEYKFSIFKIFKYDYDDGVYYVVMGYKSDGKHSLDAYILWFMKDRNKVQIWGYKDDFSSMERLIEQWNKYGINKWWYIEW
jgi:hypothetical protein